MPVVETIAGRACLPHDHPQQRRAARRDRQRLGQCARRRGRRGARGRHAPPGLHHRLLDRVRQSGGPADRAERRALRCRQAPGARGRRRQEGSSSCPPGRLARAAGAAGARRRGIRGLEPDGRSAFRPDQRHAAVLRARGRRDQPGVRSDRPRGSPRAACRASCARTGRRRPSAPSTASSASPAWATRSRAAGAPRWPTRARRDRVHGRRLLPDDELRHLFVGPDRPQADRRGLRQRRLRGDQPPAELQGQRVLQQPARGLPARGRRAGRLRQARREHGRDRRARCLDRRPGSGVRARQGRGSDLRHRDRRASAPVDARRCLVGRRGARGAGATR